MQILGIQIDRPFLREALIEINRSDVQICNLKTFLLADYEKEKRLSSKNFKGRVATGISAKHLLIRSVELKIDSPRHLEEAVAFQAEATHHFNPAEILTISQFNKNKEGTTEALLHTAHRQSLKEHLDELATLQIDPDGVSALSAGLCSFVRWRCPSLPDLIVVDLGSSEWTCVMIEKGRVKKSYSIDGGIESLLSALWEDRKKIFLQTEIEGAAKQMDLFLLKPHLNPHLSEKLNDLSRELAKTVYSFHRESAPMPILFTGRVDAFGHLAEFLKECFKDAVSSEQGVELTLDEKKYAASIGLALEQREPGPLQFRREEFFPVKNWKRIGIYAILLLLLSTLLSTGLSIFGLRAVQSRKLQMLDSLQISLDRWDPILKKKILSESEGEEQVIDHWISAIEKHNKEYSYILQAPKTAELLSWISSHPLLKALELDKDPIRIRELQYQLVQFPKIGSLQEPYQAKVEIEFQVNGSMNARKFHEALLKGDEMVDSNLPISWDALADSYRTSFFLKNRIPHDY